jgi:hypothetical protein
VRNGWGLAAVVDAKVLPWWQHLSNKPLVMNDHFSLSHVLRDEVFCVDSHASLVDPALFVRKFNLQVVCVCKRLELF